MLKDLAKLELFQSLRLTNLRGQKVIILKQCVESFECSDWLIDCLTCSEAVLYIQIGQKLC